MENPPTGVGRMFNVSVSRTVRNHCGGYMQFDRDQLETLLRAEAEAPCVSLYMPTSGNPDGAKADGINFKNLVSRAGEELKALGVEEPGKMLSPFEDMLQDKRFWSEQKEGLAMFLGSDGLREFQVPCRVRPQVVVGSGFHLKPLIPVMNSNQAFAVLALTRGDARLFLCTSCEVEELALDDLPGSVEEAARLDLSSAPFQQHSGTGGPGQGAMYHGQDRDDSSAGREDVAKYCRAVDAATQRALADHDVPLVFCGGDRLFSTYQSVSDCKKLLDENVSVNPGGYAGERLRDMAMPLAEKEFRKPFIRDYSRFYEKEASGSAAAVLQEVCGASLHNRVETLFASLDDSRWAIVRGDELEPVFELHEVRRPGDIDLVNFAAVETLLGGGKVHAVTREEVPGQQPMAAIYRY